MRILVDIVHPADVLFFLNPIRRWRVNDHRVYVASRHKDVTTQLLDAFGIEHTAVSSAGRSLPGLAFELVRRDIGLFAMARRLRPDVMCGFGAVASSHVGKLIGRPAISFYDTERAPLQNRLSLSFISHLYVPECYDGPVAGGRTSRFPGTKENSYLHPDNFAPDKEVALRAGLDPQTANFFVRLVGWQANHDVGHAGWTTETLQRVVAHLSARGKVHLSSELPLPAGLVAYRYGGSVQEVHHLLAHCDCYIGESATMASEAVTLGVPAIYAAADRRCYTDYLARQKLLWKVNPVNFGAVKLALESVAATGLDQWSQRIRRYREQTCNLAGFIERSVLSHGEQGRLSA